MLALDFNIVTLLEVEVGGGGSTCGWASKRRGGCMLRRRRPRGMVRMGLVQT